MPVKINQPIVTASVQEHAPPKSPPFRRPRILPGLTYKIKPPESISAAALYVTINDIDVAGQRRPLEMFFNSRDMQSYQWMTVLSRTVSSLWRNNLFNGFPEWVIDDFIDTTQPGGDYYIPGTGQHVTSVASEVGLVIKEHCRSLGLLVEEELSSYTKAILSEKKEEAARRGIIGQPCPKCGAPDSMVLMDNCLTCTACGESKCG